MTTTDDASVRAEFERLERRYRRERAIRIEAEAIAERATARLYEADRRKNVLFETLSHELRTPLTAIRGFAEVVIDSWTTLDDAHRLEMVRRVARNGAVLQALIEQLLDFTRFDPDRFVPRPVSFSLSRLVAEVVDQLEVVLHGHAARLEVEPDVAIAADPVALTCILTNLLTNATRYAPAATTVTVAVAAGAEWAELHVADEGPGVPLGERSMIFERFYRGQSAEATRMPGVGIGLALVKELTERMGGRVAVGDAERGGARFSVFLPRPGGAVAVVPS